MAEAEETKQDLVQRARNLPPPERFSLAPRTFDEAFRFANLIAESTLIPKEFQKSPSNVLIAVQYGMELGVSPMQALQSMYVVNGRPSIYGDLLPALVYQSGLCEQFDEDYDAKNRVATCTVKRKGFKAIARTFSWEDAQRAKAWEAGKLITLAEKQTYQSYPQRMLPMRARSWAVRDAFADVLKGLAVAEELDDYNPTIETTATTERSPALAAPTVKEKQKPTEAKGATDGEDKGQTVPGNGGAGQGNQPSAEGAEQRREPQTAGGKDRQGDSKRKEKPADPAKPPDEIPLKTELLAWIQTATTEELNSRDTKVNRIYGEALKIADINERQAIYVAFDEERRRRAAEQA